MKYEIAANQLPNTPGKFHLRNTNPEFNAAESEDLAYVCGLTFRTLRAAETELARLNAVMDTVGSAGGAR